MSGGRTFQKQVLYRKSTLCSPCDSGRREDQLRLKVEFQEQTITAGDNYKVTPALYTQCSEDLNTVLSLFITNLLVINLGDGSTGSFWSGAPELPSEALSCVGTEPRGTQLQLKDKAPCGRW